MKFFDALLGRNFRNPPREQWEEIAGAIHVRLAEDRPPFFDGCVEILSKLPNVAIVNRTLSPRIELAITIYQLHLGRELIAAHEYIRPEIINSFFDILFSGASRYGSPSDYESCIRRYWPREDNENQGQEILFFYSDIATHITGADSSLTEAIGLTAATVLRFTAVSRLAVATAFGDRKTAQQIRAAYASKPK